MTDQSADGNRNPSSGRAAASDLSASLASAGFEGAREIGRGGFGVVYRCQQVSLGRAVAVKVLASDLDEPNRERFLREGYAMGRLSGHPNIVNILQVGVTDHGRPYIVMPYHAADSLAMRIRREGPLPWPEVLRIGVKLCGALETAHRADTLHRDIKPANVLANDYGEPQLTDFGIAHIAGGYETATGFFTGTIAYTAPEVLAGAKPSAAADVYSLGATLYALIAGSAAHERRSGEELVAQYLRISSQPIPDLRAEGIPLNVCETIERAMSKDPNDRPQTAAEFGHDLQAAQKRNGLKPDTMALSTEASATEPTSSQPVFPAPPSPPSQSSVSMAGPTVFTGRNPSVPAQSGPTAPPPPGASTNPPMSAPQHYMYNQPDPAMTGGSGRNPMQPYGAPPMGPVQPADSPNVPPPPSKSGRSGGNGGNKRSKMLILGALAAVLLLVVVGSLAYFFLRDGSEGNGGDGETLAVQEDWRAVTNARTARAEAATTQADGTIWIFGGRGDNGISARHEGYDPAIDNWKGGDDLPDPVMNAAAVTWRGNPIVLGGFTGNQQPTDKVWRVVNARWVELPPMLEARAAAAAAVIGDLIIVSGGTGANGQTLSSTEIFNGAEWLSAPDMPTPRDHVVGVSDNKSMYVLGGKSGGTDVATVERFDIPSQQWSAVADMPQPTSDAGATFADGRIVVAGGEQSGKVLNTVSSFDIVSGTWSSLPALKTARHGLSLSAVGATVYAIGGATAAGDTDVTATAEALKLAPRKLQPSAEWRSMPDAPTLRLQSAWAVADGRIWVLGGLRSGQALQTVESFDPATGAWQTGPPLPIPLHHATATTYRGEVVVIGGAEDATNIGAASDRVFALRGSSWTELPAMNNARAGAAAAVVGDQLVVVGGQNEKQIVSPTEVFDGESWSEADAPPTPREHLAAVSDGKYVYTVGGRFLSADKNSAAFERFDPESGEWERLPDMPTPRGSYGAAIVDGRIVAVGGEEPTRVLGTVEAYDIAEGTWQELPWLPTPRHAEVVAAVGNTVYVIGGANRPTHEGPIATVEALDFV